MKPKKHEIPRIPTAGEGNSLGQWKSFLGDTKDQSRPRCPGHGSLTDEETKMMDLTAPVNPLAEVLGHLLPLVPLAKMWLEKQVGEVARPRAEAESLRLPVKEWYTPQEASAEINRTPNYVRELCRKKIFGKLDAGGRWFINRKELDAFRLGRLKVHGEDFK